MKPLTRAFSDLWQLDVAIPIRMATLSETAILLGAIPEAGG